MTIIFTILTAVLAFTLGQILIKFFLDPIKELRGYLYEINFHLEYYAWFYRGIINNDSNDPKNFGGPFSVENINLIMGKTRELSCKLGEYRNKMCVYNLISFLHIVPNKKIIKDIRIKLMGLSGASFTQSIEEKELHIKNREDLKNLFKKIRFIEKY